jgi:hypothetical protein
MEQKTSLYKNLSMLFYTGITGLIVFEILNVYFIMPMPGSQRMPSIEMAYFLYKWRWVFRGIFGIFIVTGFWQAFKISKWWSVPFVVAGVAVMYLFNFEMAADKMFEQPKKLVMANTQNNKIKDDKIVIAIAHNGEARAYPIQLIAYHHQVLDTITGKPIMVTYCSVCRTGRIFEPTVAGKAETFRLVGMDHFNAMFEDKTTRSWWRQANGEAIMGKLTGQTLPELTSEQTTLRQWLELHPNSLIMQEDKHFHAEYDTLGKYEAGKGKSQLTRTDSLSWKEKSWVVGIANGKTSKAFDWNRLKREKVINETVGNQPVVLALAADMVSFFAFERPDSTTRFRLKNNLLQADTLQFNLKGENLTDPDVKLKRIRAYQEFWHSWQTFHPETEKY